MTHLTAFDSPRHDAQPDSGDPSPHDRVDMRDRVLVYEATSSIPALATLLGQLNCTPVFRQSAQCEIVAARPRAVIISDELDHAIEICASLPPDFPKILIASAPSFAFRCAAARAGVEAVIERPIDVNELSDWLEHFRLREAPQPISVLLIDDHLLTAEIHAAALRRSGIQVTIITQPAEVLPAIEAIAPDLVLMDIHMPGVDGIELASIIRQSRDYLSLPIAFLSAESDEGRKMAARKCGGDDFISKPVDLMRLAGHVRLRAERARAMRSLIERDSLTGLLNHGAFRERVAAELERSRRTGSALSLVMLDLDRFKVVNDTYGHPVGDKVLRTLAHILVGRLRATDLVGRYGGEEFTVLLLDTEPAVARGVIDSVRQQFQEIVFDDPAGGFGVTFSAGLASSHERSTAQLFSAADEALYRAKRGGRNAVKIAGEARRAPALAIPR